jgi:hypothetical protein
MAWRNEYELTAEVMAVECGPADDTCDGGVPIYLCENHRRATGNSWECPGGWKSCKKPQDCHEVHNAYSESELSVDGVSQLVE